MAAEIQTMTIADYPAVYALWSRTEGMGLNESDTEAGIRSFLGKNPQLSLVLRSGDQLHGAMLVGTDGRRGFLYHLAVDVAHRGRGLGGRLVQEGIRRLANVGVIRCNVVVYANNHAGQSFWNHMGFDSRPEVVLMSRRPKSSN